VKRGWLRRRLADHVVVHLSDDTSIAGYLEEVARDGVILRAAQYLDAERPVAIQGETFIPRNRIAWVQVQTGTLEQ
jgi:hypothetical protein